MCAALALKNAAGKVNSRRNASSTLFAMWLKSFAIKGRKSVVRGHEGGRRRRIAGVYCEGKISTKITVRVTAARRGQFADNSTDENTRRGQVKFNGRFFLAAPRQVSCYITFALYSFAPSRNLIT